MHTYTAYIESQNKRTPFRNAGSLFSSVFLPLAHKLALSSIVFLSSDMSGEVVSSQNLFSICVVPLQVCRNMQRI